MITKYDPTLASSVTATGQQVLGQMIRKLMPGVIDHQIMSVQPMYSPSGRIFTMKYNYTPEPKHKFSRAKWFEAKRSLSDPGSDWPAVKYSREQYSWCVTQFGPSPLHPDAWSRWYMIYDRFRFRDERDYILFTLRWS